LSVILFTQIQAQFTYNLQHAKNDSKDTLIGTVNSISTCNMPTIYISQKLLINIYRPIVRQCDNDNGK